MKKSNCVFGLMIGVIGIALAVGVQTFARPCQHDKELITAITITGGALAVLAGLGIIVPNRIISFLSAAGGVAVILIPGTFVRICADGRMRCQMYTKPTAIVTGVLIAVLSLIWFIQIWKNRKCV